MSSHSRLTVRTDLDGCDVLDEDETFMRNILAGKLAGYRCSISVRIFFLNKLFLFFQILGIFSNFKR